MPLTSKLERQLARASAATLEAYERAVTEDAPDDVRLEIFLALKRLRAAIHNALKVSSCP